MSQLQNCIVMCTKNGSYCENEKRGGGGQGRCERRSEAFVNIQKKKIFFFYFFFFGGGRGSGRGEEGVRLDVNGEVKLL